MSEKEAPFNWDEDPSISVRRQVPIALHAHDGTVMLSFPSEEYERQQGADAAHAVFISLENIDALCAGLMQAKQELLAERQSQRAVSTPRPVDTEGLH